MTAEKQTKPKKPTNLLILSGWFLTISAFAMGCVLIVIEALFVHNPYFGLVTYTLTPAGMTCGVGMILLGLLVQRRRRRQNREGEFKLPNLDLNEARVRITILGVGLGLMAFVAVSGVASYRGYHFTESNEFCGQVCHQVMEPEYEAHTRSAHARVDCVSCHIGSGAGWFVRAKLSGLRQVYHVLNNSYKLPIETPLDNLRPARDTCEQCHWPEKFEGSVERVLWRFWYDKDNTPSVYHLLMRVGGVNPASGRPEGIHWHSDASTQVRYWATDHKRTTIPWVEVVEEDGSRTVFKSDPQAAPPSEQDVRVMDCMDCHNRPAHVFLPPDLQVDRALSKNQLDRKIPYIKRNAVHLLSYTYSTEQEAGDKIRAGIEEKYPLDAEMTQARRDKVVDKLLELYSQHNYPRQGVNWATYQTNQAHKNFPGCFRCHDGKHVSEAGKAISHECETCHDFIYQAHGEEAFGEVTFKTEPFEHPGRVIIDDPDEHKRRACSDCHDPRVGWYPGNLDPDEQYRESEGEAPEAAPPSDPPQ